MDGVVSAQVYTGSPDPGALFGVVQGQNTGSKLSGQVDEILLLQLGAAALGDIGKLFPDTDAAYAGISSILLLERVAERLREAGYAVVNLDATVLAQAPKLAPYRERMRENLARALSLDAYRVSVKATTEEGLGFTGEGLGIAAHAVALLEKIG